MLLLTYPQKYVLQIKKSINVKVFNIITRINEAKTWTKPISRDCKRKYDSAKCNSNQKWNNETCQCECKIIVSTKKIIIGIPAHVFVKMVSIKKVLLMNQ